MTVVLEATLQELATSLIDLYQSHDHLDIPGFDYIGEGASRRVYRNGDYVFKVEFDWYDDLLIEGYANVLEAQNSQDFKERLQGHKDWVVPDAQLFKVGKHSVLVMDYIAGESLDEASFNDYEYAYHAGACEEVNDFLGTVDIYAQNVKMLDGKYYIIDMGEDSCG